MICELEGCNVEFTPKNTLQRYCNPKHRQKAADKRYADRGELQSCARQECDIRFKTQDKRKKYCSHSCAMQVLNRERFYQKWISKECKTCGTPFSGPSESKYCGKVCLDAGRKKRSQDKILQWIKNDSDWSDKSHGLARPARNFLLEEAGYKCTKCGWGEPNPVTGKPILSIDHINGNWKDNRRSNLVVLCYNCHTLTPTFGSLNMGSDSGRRPGKGNRRR